MISQTLKGWKRLLKGMCYQTWVVIKSRLHYCYESLFHFHHEALAVCRSESLFNWHLRVMNQLFESVSSLIVNLTLFIAFRCTYIIMMLVCLYIWKWKCIWITARWMSCTSMKPRSQPILHNVSYFWAKWDIQQ